VDTLTKTMSAMLAGVKAFKEAGVSGYAYTGGYEIPPRSLTESARTDILYVEEIIGTGEVAIADRRAPEPSADTFAKIIIDSYVAGLLSNKAGVTRVHVGDGRRRLQTIRDVFERHEIKHESLYLTHIERSKELVLEGIELAKKGTFLDFDIHDNDLEVWYKYYVESGGPLDKLSFSSDGGICSPTEIWNEVRKCSLSHKCFFGQMISHMTAVPAAALKLKNKGHIRAGADADIVVAEKNELVAVHVMANGKFCMKDAQLLSKKLDSSQRRKEDWYAVHH
jgi:beta-aspartyl-dipeptidase (metallo-type)